MDFFVFGSNRKGIHGAGAALFASRRYGAQRGVGEGITGQSYALPTKAGPYDLLTLDQIREHVQRFIAHATAHSSDRFLLTKVGCGYAMRFRQQNGQEVIAPYNERDIAALFKDAPANVVSIDDQGKVIGLASQWHARVSA